MKHPTQIVLELACAAQRYHGAYIKEGNTVWTEDNKAVAYVYSNKVMMLNTVSPSSEHREHPIPLLNTNMSDKELADKIKHHFRKFMFAAVDGENDFATNINTLLNSEEIEEKMFGYIACLPSVYVRDVTHTRIKKIAGTVDEEYLAEVGANLKDLDCEILESIKSKNFEGYNICAIISNRMVSWINKTDLVVGPCVVVKAKVKDHVKHWKHANPVTRLNYVKAAQ